MTTRNNWARAISNKILPFPCGHVKMQTADCRLCRPCRLGIFILNCSDRVIEWQQETTEPLLSQTKFSLSPVVMLKCRLQTADRADHADCADWEFLLTYYFSVSFTLGCWRCVYIYFLLFSMAIDAWKPGMVLEKICNQCPSGQKF